MCVYIIILDNCFSISKLGFKKNTTRASLISEIKVVFLKIIEDQYNDRE